MDTFRPVYHALLDLADEHLEAAVRYTLCLPGQSRRLRIACMLPIIIGQRTVDLLRTSNVLDPAHRVKVDRAEIKRILRRCVLATMVPGGTKRADRLPPRSPLSASPALMALARAETGIHKCTKTGKADADAGTPEALDLVLPLKGNASTKSGRFEREQLTPLERLRTGVQLATGPSRPSQTAMEALRDIAPIHRLVR